MKNYSINNNILNDAFICANIYDKELSHRNLLFIVQNDKDIEYIEASFEPEQFQHLTGLSYKNQNGEVDSLSFYKQCTTKSLNLTNVYIKQSKSTREIKDKLIALKETAAIHKNARMIGDYNYNGVALKTEKFAGSVSACLGFIIQGKYYIPNTNIKSDIRTKINCSKPILAILRKDIKEDKYTEITHTKKNFEWADFLLPKEILSKLTETAQISLTQIEPPSPVEKSKSKIPEGQSLDDMIARVKSKNKENQVSTEKEIINSISRDDR